jgi:hypothetical protein
MKTDTPPKVLEEWNRLYQELSAEERLKRGFALIQTARTMAENSLRKRYPNLSEHEFKKELVRWLYGDKMAALVDEKPTEPSDK